MNNAFKLRAAAAAVILVGVIALKLGTGTVLTGGAPLSLASPSPSPASQEIPASGIGSAVALPAGRYHIDQSSTGGYDEPSGVARVSFEVPAGWLGENERYAMIRKGYGGSPSGLVMAVRTIGRAYYDPCHTVGAEARGDYVDFSSFDPQPGHLDRALARLGEQWGDDASSPLSAGFAPDSPTVTKTTEITIAGLAGRYVEVRTPADLDLASCDGFAYVLWRDSLVEQPGRLHVGSAGQLDRLWIVDLDGADPENRSLLVVIAASAQPGVSAEDLAELQVIVESIKIEYETRG